MTLPCSYLIFDVCDGYYGCKCSNGYEMTTHDTITIELIDDDDEDNDDNDNNVDGLSLIHISEPTRPY